MLWGAHNGGLEMRQEGGEIRLRATFPYGRETTLSDGGRSGKALKEVISARAFGSKINSGEDIHFLSGHEFNKPLASRSAGTLHLTDTDQELIIDAVISREMESVSYVRDFLAAHSSGLVRGLSPGFRVAPRGETIEERSGAIVRTVRSADLIEISAVTRPAYPDAQIEARSWQAGIVADSVKSTHALNRWRL